MLEAPGPSRHSVLAADRDARERGPGGLELERPVVTKALWLPKPRGSWRTLLGDSYLSSLGLWGREVPGSPRGLLPHPLAFQGHGSGDQGAVRGACSHSQEPSCWERCRGDGPSTFPVLPAESQEPAAASALGFRPPCAWGLFLPLPSCSQRWPSVPAQVPVIQGHLSLHLPAC